MLTDMTLGQYYPGHSYLHQMDPRAKILCTMIFIVAIFLANNLYSYIVVAGFTFLAIALSGVPAKMIWKAIKPLWVILVFTMLIHILTTPGTEIFSWKFIHISEEGIRNGIVMTLRLVFLIAFSSLLTYTTSPIVLTDGIEDLLMPFRRFGVPAHELAMMMTIALRFIPTLLEETDRIMKAQSSRGADFVNGNLWQRAKNMIPLLVPLFISAFRRADDLHIRLCAKRFAKVFPQQRKVVRQQYFHHSLTCPAHIWAAARRKTCPSPAGSPPADCPHAHAQSCAHDKAPCPSSCCCFWMNKMVQKSSSALLG